MPNDDIPIRDTLTVEIHFDGELDGERAQEFVSVLADELEFRDLRDGRYHKQGWGMGTARVIGVEHILQANT